MIRVDKTQVQYKGRFGDIIVEIIMLLRELRETADFDEEDFEFIKKNTFMSSEELAEEAREILMQDKNQKQKLDEFTKEIDSLLDFLNDIKRMKDKDEADD